MKTTGCLVLAALLCLGGTALGQGGVPDLPNCQAWTAYEGDGIPTLCVYPDGGGPPFTQAQLPDGTVVDCTVFLQIRDGNDDPVAHYPREDLWLESFDGGLFHCNGGTIADVDTDQSGTTYWSEPPEAGGFSESSTAVMVNGDSVWAEGLALSYNSPDITGDGMVNLSDVGWFAMDYFTDYHFRSDLHRDGVLNLSDLGALAQGFMAQCD